MGDSSMTEIEFRAEALKLLCPNGFGDNGVEIRLPDGSSDTVPSQEQLDAKIAELKADYNAKQYQRDRKLEYPTIEELVVALYDESDKQAIIEKRNAVKAKYPKPE
jgi:hypothetical protein